MSQSLSKLFVHGVFHTKYNIPIIRPAEEKELYAYIGSIIKDNQSIPIVINGVEDHVHVLFVMSKNIALAKIMEEMKRHSSRWIKTKDAHYAQFAWQGGYGGFSVSPSLYETTKRYIENQKQHHKRQTFKEEYVMFLEKYGIEYDERYLWTD